MSKRDRSSVGSKRDRSRAVLKRHRSSEELLPHDVVELIFERLPVKSLLRFKSVSNKWKSTIESQRFQERLLILRRQSRGPDVLFVDVGADEPGNMRIFFGSSMICTVRFPTLATLVCHGSCDGLVCLYGLSLDTPNTVVNPATRWNQSFSLSSFQRILIEKFRKKAFSPRCPKLGFGKNKFGGTYKPVWLYNSAEFGLDNVTTCEVFDFSTNAWRYVHPSSPYRILTNNKPVHLDGSLYWFTECEETKLLSFDLQTETFQVISKAPFPRMRNPCDITMCILDNRLCVSEKNWPNQVIWSFDSSSGNKTWKNLCSIDLTKTRSWFGEPESALLPIAILDKTKLLLQASKQFQPLVIHDLHTKSYDLVSTPTGVGTCVYYFDSLFSSFSN